jgi:hypothetical protein
LYLLTVIFHRYLLTSYLPVHPWLANEKMKPRHYHNFAVCSDRSAIE